MGLELDSVAGRMAALLLAAGIILAAARTSASREMRPTDVTPSPAPARSAAAIPTPSPTARPIDRPILAIFQPPEATKKQVEAIDPENGSRMRIGGFAMEAAWSPDAKQIAFSASSPMRSGGACGVSSIWVQSLNGKAMPITNCWDSQPAWSPDGKWIAFTRRRYNEFGHYRGTQIWIIRPDGSDARAITDPGMYTTDWYYGDPDVWGDSEPDWSPDSKNVVFVRRETAGVEPGVWVQPLDRAARRLDVPHGSWGPDWSPDGERLAIVVQSPGDGTSYNLAVFEFDTQRLTTLTSQRPYDSERDGTGFNANRRFQPRNVQPAWSSDGRRIAYASNRDHEYDNDDSSEVYVMNADGSDQRRLTFHRGAPSGTVSFSPDDFKVMDW